MRLLIEIATATLLVVCITFSTAASAAGRPGRSADGLSCAVSLPQNATSAARCAAIKRQCGGKFYASACGDKLMSAAR
jgi:Tfp pilus assembly protein FimV